MIKGLFRLIATIFKAIWWIVLQVYLILSFPIRLIIKHFKKGYTLEALDEMDGYSFETACAEILKSNGFKKVRTTKSSGDFGVDIIAEYKKEMYAVQCKCYTKKLNNKAVQEVIGGLAYYNCDTGAVMTNSYFTKPARELAEVNQIELWDRDVLSQMIKNKKSNTEQTDE